MLVSLAWNLSEVLCLDAQGFVAAHPGAMAVPEEVAVPGVPDASVVKPTERVACTVLAWSTVKMGGCHRLVKAPASWDHQALEAAATAPRPVLQQGVFAFVALGDPVPIEHGSFLARMQDHG